MEATDLYRQVVLAFPDDAQAHDGLGELLLRQRKYEEALKEFDRAIAIDPAFENAKQDRDQALEAAHKNDVIRVH